MAEHDVSVSLGGYLRALREAGQGSLEEMARATRVSLRHLEALESGRLSELPAPVFVKGFIRAYCHFLGESPDEALGRYRDVLGERPAPEARPPAERPAPAWSGSPIFISLVLLVLFGFSLLAVNLGFRRGSKPTVPDLAPGARVEAPSPAATPGPSPAPPIAAADATAGSPTAQRLLVKALEATWIRIQPDDRGAVEEQRPQAREPLRLSRGAGPGRTPPDPPVHGRWARCPALRGPSRRRCAARRTGGGADRLRPRRRGRRGVRQGGAGGGQAWTRGVQPGRAGAPRAFPRRRSPMRQ